MLVDGRNNDDAGVILIDDNRALVFTTDFFTPVVDDAFTYGAIAAANALSDIYAMGGRPVCALNILGIPRGRVPSDIVSEIIHGAADKCAEARVAILGGHSIRNPEPVFGMAVVGLASPDRLLRNDAAKPGLDIVLTKPIGSGIITTASMRDIALPNEIAGAIRWMSRLNDNAGKAALKFGSQSATDITGFGLLGHLYEVAAASGISMEITLSKVPLMHGARRLLEERTIPGGTVGNLESLNGKVVFPESMHELDRLLLCDAQTSGGLAITVARNKTAELIKLLKEGGDTESCVIGRTVKKKDYAIRVVE